jgi:hypothetical protein
MTETVGSTSASAELLARLVQAELPQSSRAFAWPKNFPSRVSHNASLGAASSSRAFWRQAHSITGGVLRSENPHRLSQYPVELAPPVTARGSNRYVSGSTPGSGFPELIPHGNHVRVARSAGTKDELQWLRKERRQVSANLEWHTNIIYTANRQTTRSTEHRADLLGIACLGVADWSRLRFTEYPLATEVPGAPPGLR